MPRQDQRQRKMQNGAKPILSARLMLFAMSTTAMIGWRPPYLRQLTRRLSVDASFLSAMSLIVSTEKRAAISDRTSVAYMRAMLPSLMSGFR